MLWLGLSTLALASGVLVTWWLHPAGRGASGRHRHVGLPIPAASPDPHGPLISAIIPARNEARNVRPCLEALLAQTYPRLEVLVVDDCSTDQTPEILAELAARHPPLRVIPGAPLPPGWVGKPHALAQGADAARGEWLCFVDADTFAAPDLVASTYAAAQAYRADLFTILTRQELGSFWEKVVMPVVFSGMAVGFPPERINDPQKPDAVANGQFILIRRAVYDAVGGHRAVRQSIVEDKALAEWVKRLGYRLILGDGRALAWTRMYTSLPEIWEGWTKNIYLGGRDRLGLLLFGAAVCLSAALVLPAWLAAGVLWLAMGGGLPAAVVSLEAAALWCAVVYARARVAAAFDISRGYALTLPLGTLLFAAMMFASAFKVLSGKGVTWKGRRYAEE